MFVCMYNVCLCVYIMYVYIMNVHIYICMYVCVHVCVYVLCMHVCMCVYVLCMYVGMCVCTYVCVYVCSMYYAERKNLPAEILLLSSLPHHVTLCLSPHCNTNSRNFHPTLHEISFLSPRQFMHQLCCTGINCLSFLERALLFKYLPTTLNTLILVTKLSRTSQPLEHFHKLLCIYYVLRLLPLLYDSLKT